VPYGIIVVAVCNVQAVQVAVNLLVFKSFKGLLAVGVDSAAERAYLDMMAARLRQILFVLTLFLPADHQRKWYILSPTIRKLFLRMRFGMQLSKSNKKGEVAPSFTLKGENGREVRLEDFAGNWLLMVFHRHLA
jgi:hypothetical protein